MVISGHIEGEPRRAGALDVMEIHRLRRDLAEWMIERGIDQWWLFERLVDQA